MFFMCNAPELNVAARRIVSACCGNLNVFKLLLRKSAEWLDQEIAHSNWSGSRSDTFASNFARGRLQERHSKTPAKEATEN